MKYICIVFTNKKNYFNTLMWSFMGCNDVVVRGNAEVIKKKYIIHNECCIIQ